MAQYGYGGYISMSAIFGKQIGKYKLLEVLGAGGMAMVYNAVDRRLERNVALKIILPSRQSSQLFLSRFLTEAKALAQLSHTNIVKVLDYGEEDGLPYLVMEFIPGGTMRDQINGPIPWQEAAAMLAPIARALEYVHNQKIVHRDIKPSNILIDENGQPMLSDFGIVKLIEENEPEVTGTNVGVGTPEYMSPEQGMGRPIDYRADIYALGIVFFELVTGQKPFTAETPMGVVIKQVKQALPKPHKFVKKLPQFVEDVILKATAKKPENRFGNMGEFVEALEQLAAGPKRKINRIDQLTGRARSKKLAARFFSISASLLILSAIIILLWPTIRVRQAALLASRPTQKATVTHAAIALKPTSTHIPLTPTPTITFKSTSTPAPINTSNEITPTAQAVLLRDNPLPKLIPVGHGMAQIAIWGIGRSSSVAWSPDGKLVAVGSSVGLFLYDPNTLKMVRFIDTQHWVTRIAFSQDSKTIAVGSKPANAKSNTAEEVLDFWNVATGENIRSIDQKIPQNFNTLTGIRNPEVTALAYSSNKHYLAAGYSNGVINILDSGTGEILQALGQLKNVGDLDFSPDNRYLASAGEGEINIWDISTGKLVNTIHQHGSITSLVYTPNEGQLIVGSSDWTIRLYDPNMGSELKVYTAKSAIQAIDISQDGITLAIAQANGTVTILNIKEWKEISSSQVDQKIVQGVSLSPDGQSVAVSSWYESLRILQSSTSQEISSLKQNIDEIDKLIFSPDGKWLAAHSIDNTIRVWDVAIGVVKYNFQGHIPEGNPYSSDSRFLIIASDPTVSWLKDGVLSIIDLQTGNTFAKFTGYIRGWFVGFSPDQETLISGDLYQANLWDLSTLIQLRTHGGHNAGCGNYYTPDSRLLATISDAGIIYQHSDKITKLCGTRDAGKAKILDITPDLSWVAVQPPKGGIFPWNILSDLELELTKYNDYSNLTDFLGYSTDSQLAFFASSQKDELYMGDPVSFAVIWTMQQFNEFNFKIAAPTNRNMIALGANDGTIRIWGLKK
jgi:serine/threonine protein kinase